MNRKKLLILALFAIFLAGLAAACNLPTNRDETPEAGINATEAHQTVEARVTNVALQTAAAGTGTVTQETPTPGTPTPTTLPGTPSATSSGPTATASSTRDLCDVVNPGNPIDVTIPDDTEIAIGAVFTKTWRLVNGGTCTWTNQYAVVWDSGDQLGVENVVFLSGSVSPGASVDVSVVMQAPNTPDTYQSNWKMRNAAGVLFGLDGTGPFWARIEAVRPTATPTVSPSPSPTASTTPTPTSTPVVQASGTRELVVGNQINLDNLFINDGAGNDLSYVTNVNDEHVLNPQGGAQIGVYGGSQPGLFNCQSAGLGQGGISIESQGVGVHLCFLTDQGRYGFMRIAAFDQDTGSLTLEIVTWQTP